MGFFLNRRVLCRILPASTIIWNFLVIFLFFFCSKMSMQARKKVKRFIFCLAKDAVRAFNRFFYAIHIAKWNSVRWSESTRCEIQKYHIKTEWGWNIYFLRFSFKYSQFFSFGEKLFLDILKIADMPTPNCHGVLFRHCNSLWKLFNFHSNQTEQNTANRTSLSCYCYHYIYCKCIWT